MHTCEQKRRVGTAMELTAWHRVALQSSIGSGWAGAIGQVCVLTPGCCDARCQQSQRQKPRASCRHGETVQELRSSIGLSTFIPRLENQVAKQTLLVSHRSHARMRLVGRYCEGIFLLTAVQNGKYWSNLIYRDNFPSRLSHYSIAVDFLKRDPRPSVQLQPYVMTPSVT